MTYYDDWNSLEPRGDGPIEELGAAVIVLTVLIVMALLSGCVPRTSPTVAPESPFDLRVMPAIAFSGSTVRLTCYVPESMGRGVIRLALEGARVTGPKEIEHAQNVLEVERVECGTWRATCRVAAEGGVRVVERALEVRGGVCEPGG